VPYFAVISNIEEIDRLIEGAKGSPNDFALVWKWLTAKAGITDTRAK
jgi:hypothetical protein